MLVFRKFIMVQENAETEEKCQYKLLTSLHSRFKRMSFKENRTPASPQLKIDLERIRKHLSEPDTAYFLMDSHDCLPQFLAHNTFSQNYTREEFEITPFTHLLSQEDEQLFLKAIEESDKKHAIKGFEFGTSLLTPKNQLTHYNLEAQISGINGRSQQVQIFLRRTNKEWCSVTNKKSICLENLLNSIPHKDIPNRKATVEKEVKKKLKEGVPMFRGATYIQIKGSTFPEYLIPTIGNLMYDHKDLYIIGTTSLNDQVYTAFRHPILEISRERLSIKPLVYHERKSSRIPKFITNLWHHTSKTKPKNSEGNQSDSLKKTVLPSGSINLADLKPASL